VGHPAVHQPTYAQTSHGSKAITCCPRFENRETWGAREKTKLGSRPFAKNAKEWGTPTRIDSSDVYQLDLRLG
jgi:hypothetical protein